MRPAAQRFFLFFLLIALHWGGLGTTPILDRDEARFAEATRDMAARGDWVVPHFNGEPRYNKPILIYWLQGAAFSILGPTELAVRLPSVLCGALLCVLVYELGRTLYSGRVGLLAALLVGTAPIAWAEARVGTADAAMTAFLAAALLSSCRARTSQRPVTWALLGGGALGLSVLAKGPVALAIVLLSALASWVLRLLVRRDARAEALAPSPGIPRRPMLLALGSIALLSVALPWALAAGFRTDWAFWREGIGHHFLDRLPHAHEGHRMFPGAHTLLLSVTCFPWAPWIPAGIARAWREARSGGAGARFLLGWALGPLLMFEAASSRLPHYTYPLIPAFALLAAKTIAGDGEAPRGKGPAGRGSPRALPAILPPISILAVGILLLSIWPIAARISSIEPIPSGKASKLAWTACTDLRSRGIDGIAFAAGIALVGGGTIAWLLARRRGPLPSLAAALSAWTAALVLGSALAVPRLPALRISRSIVRAIASRDPGKSDAVFLVSYGEPSLVFYLRRDLFPEPGQVTEDVRGLGEKIRERRPAWIIVSPEALEAAEKADVPLEVLDRVKGLNLSKGREVELLIVRAR